MEPIHHLNHSNTDRKREHFRNLKDKLKVFRHARQDYLEAYRKDPLARILIGTLKSSPRRSAMIGLGIVLFTYMLGIGLYFILGREVAGITQTGIDLAFDITLIPLTYAVYIWVSRSQPYLFLKLQENGITLPKPAEYHRLITRAVNRVLNHPWIFIFSGLAALFTAAVYILTARGKFAASGDVRTNLFVLYFFKVPITWLIPWYMVCVIFIKEAVFIRIFRKLMTRRDIKINVFHLDRCGGFKPISDYLLKFSFYIMSCGFGFILLILRSLRFGYFRNDGIVHLGLILYLILSIFNFYFPLHPVHRVMSKLREEMTKNRKLSQYIPSWAFPPITFAKYLLAVSIPPLVLIFIKILR